MLESFLGEDVFRAGIRSYMAKHKFSNTTTADLWNALADASGKPVVEIAAAWTQQPGFPVVKVERRIDGKIALTQERFTINYPDAPPLEWQIPLTYTVAGTAAPVSVLMSGKTMELTEIPADCAVKFNAEGAGNYRVQYDDASWKLLVAEFANLSVPDRVNLLSDAWALVQADRAPVSHYLALIEKLPTHTELAEQQQIITAFLTMHGLIPDPAKREQFQQYARGILRPSFEAIGWEPKPGESARHVALRGSLITALGDLNDQGIIDGCRDRFRKFVADPGALPADLRPPVLDVVGRYADEPTWNKLHELGMKTTSVEEKQNYYEALASVTDPKLAGRALEIALTDELPTSRAVTVVPRVAGSSGHPEIAWQFAKKNMKQLLAKADALAATSYAPSLFTFFSDHARVDELRAYAKSNLPAGAARAVEKAADEITFRAEFSKRIVEQMADWNSATPPRT
jgi:aminopeptidase N